MLVGYMEQFGAISARGVAIITAGELNSSAARNALVRGVELGIFEELPAAPGVYRLASDPPA